LNAVFLGPMWRRLPSLLCSSVTFRNISLRNLL
jgi:hypothetical protein